VTRPEIRIGDQEREAAVAALGEHYVAGRLTKEEFDERTERAWRARTNPDLAPLFADLPALREPARVAEPAPQGSSSRGKDRWSRPPVLPILLLVVVVAAVSGLEVWPLLLLFGVYLWLRMWMGMARMHRWVRHTQHRVTYGTSMEPWRRHGRPRC
jgi:hypothetical protein